MEDNQLKITFTGVDVATAGQVLWASRLVRKYLVSDLGGNHIEIVFTELPSGILFRVNDLDTSMGFTEEFWARDGKLFGSENPSAPILHYPS